MTQNNQLPIKRLIAQSISVINGPFDNVCRMKMFILADIGPLTLYIEMDFPTTSFNKFYLLQAHCGHKS